jgi:hypothetical protein
MEWLWLAEAVVFIAVAITLAITIIKIVDLLDK